MCVFVDTMRPEDHGIPWTWSYRELYSVCCGRLELSSLGTGLTFSATVIRTLNLCIISPALKTEVLKLSEHGSNHGILQWRTRILLSRQRRELSNCGRRWENPKSTLLGKERRSEKATHILTFHHRTFWERQNDPGSEGITAWTVQVMESKQGFQGSRTIHNEM